MSNNLLTMKGITKRFPGTLALDSVDFQVNSGEVHILLGENGAGKSTLVKIISGVYQLDEGEMIFDGDSRSFHSVHDAQTVGIGIIHQELNVFPEKTIAENIYVGNEPTLAALPFVLDKKKMNENAKVLLKKVGLDLPPTTLVKDLSIAQQQMVEVAKALSNDVKLLIMDEPTSSLTNREISKLFTIIDELKSQNIAIIYISHRMEEITIVGDRVTILRDGQYIDTVEVPTMVLDDVVNKMVGRSVADMYDRSYNEPGEELLRTEDLTGLRFRNINIKVHAGEIVSLSGLVGAGRTEIAKAIFGYDPIMSGNVYLNGEHRKKMTPKFCVNEGAAFLPEDRKQEGLILPMDITDNIVMSCHCKVSKGGLYSEEISKDIANEYKDRLKIVTPTVDKVVYELSGGNQQKVVIAKWLALGCDLYIFDEPTRGIDIGAKAEIHALMDDLVRQGAGILMISSELSEVVGLSDRVYVIKDGDQVAELAGDAITQEGIMRHAVGGTETK